MVLRIYWDRYKSVLKVQPTEPIRCKMGISSPMCISPLLTYMVMYHTFLEKSSKFPLISRKNLQEMTI